MTEPGGGHITVLDYKRLSHSLFDIGAFAICIECGTGAGPRKACPYCYGIVCFGCLSMHEGEPILDFVRMDNPWTFVIEGSWV